MELKEVTVQWNDKVFAISKEGFPALALEVFRYQAKENEVYRSYLQALKVAPASVSRIEQIPFLPIRFFKTARVCTGKFDPAVVFESSGTTGMVNSKHYVKDLALYESSFLKCFELFYGNPKDWCIIGLLPSYLERQHSSLVYMVDKLVGLSGHPESGFYLDEYEQLNKVLGSLEKKGQKTWLIGVSFALLDWSERYPMHLKQTVVIETGGMKGRREELIRPELHQRLVNAFQVSSIHSEYGMTELMSQAYSTGAGIFNCPSWMRILLRDEEDPFLITGKGTGTLNIIDLANIHSCSFIATDDVGKLNEDGSFEVWGRVDGSDLRGCSLMVV